MIAEIEITLDENVPEYMSGIIRAGSVVSIDENGHVIKEHDDLIDNREYHSEENLIADIASRLKVPEDKVSISS